MRWLRSTSEGFLLSHEYRGTFHLHSPKDVLDSTGCSGSRLVRPRVRSRTGDATSTAQGKSASPSFVLLFMAVGKLRLGFETNRRTLLMTGGEWEQASVDPVSRCHR